MLVVVTPLQAAAGGRGTEESECAELCRRRVTCTAGKSKPPCEKQSSTVTRVQGMRAEAPPKPLGAFTLRYTPTAKGHTVSPTKQAT